jgi:transcriptional repressor NrdR
MRCPACASDDTRVVDSRLHGGGFAVRRRRECSACQNRFSTLEEMELLDLTVQKSDGRKEPYNKEKLTAGLRKALEKRPCTADQMRELLHAIERDIQAARRDCLETGRIGEIVINHLRKFDPVAYIRFASVYRSFEDIGEFRKELDTFKEKKRA